MQWNDLELGFNRALSFSLSRKKFFLVFPTLLFCGMLVVLCRVLSEDAGGWMRISLGFLPFFLISWVLAVLGILLIRVYHHEVKKLPVLLRQTLLRSRNLLIEISYLALPFLLVYLLLWAILGVFYLFREIPGLGAALFLGPFLLVLGSFLLSGVTVLLLFFITPAAALNVKLSQLMIKEVWQRVKTNPFSAAVFFFLALLPLLIVGGLLSLSAAVTEAAYFLPDRTLFLALEWFFIMIPFAAVTAPLFVFFFNFSAESYMWLKKK